MREMKFFVGIGRNWALTGTDGDVKSGICASVAGSAKPPKGIVIEFDDDYEDQIQIVSFAQQRSAAQKGGFMQARYHSIIDDAGPGDTVEEFLAFERIFDVNPFEVGRNLKKERKAYAQSFRRIVRLFNLAELLDRDFLALSNGETRRVLIARALLAAPKVLVLDDPCAGLDPSRREQFKKICDAIAARGVMLFMSVRHEDEIPDCVTDVAVIESGKIKSVAAHSPAPVADVAHTLSRHAQSGVHDSGSSVPEVVAIRDLRISFGSRKLFDDFTWIVRKGERWVLRGANGSGKTTLLSLITGDNPQGYANDVTVFGHKRGAEGVELAKIRRRIGMISPELQAYTGKTSVELLNEALKKNPSLLLLDEPCLNLDEKDSLKLRRLVTKWLKEHKQSTAICVVHRDQDLPEGFTYELRLGASLTSCRS